MANSPFIVDVTQATFASAVIERSKSVPVMVDFWAAWCGPCQSLMPILAKLAQEYGGKFILAKVDTDHEQRLAGQYGIRGLPTVKIFKDGAVVHEFSGVQPEKTIRAAIDKLLPRPTDHEADVALEEYRAGQVDAALARLRHALETDAGNTRLRLTLARILLEQGQLDAAETALKALPPDVRSQTEASALFARLEFARIGASAPPLPELEKAIVNDPANSAARYQLGAAYVLREDYEAALQQLLDLVRRDRQYGNDAARKAVIAVFNLLGGNSELVKKYRTQLSLALH